MGAGARFGYKGDVWKSQSRRGAMMPAVSLRVASGGPPTARLPGARRMTGDGWRLAAFPALILAALLAVPHEARAADCPTVFDTMAHVTGIDASGDLILSDARIARLAGLAFDDDMPPVRAALEQLAVGRAIAIASTSMKPDRYGRLSGLIRVGEDGPTLQQALLVRGLALAQPEEGMLGCMPEHVEAERPAREKRLGLWARLPLAARDIAALNARQGRFTILTGRVRSVGKGRGVDYLNFGPIWRQDTTVRLDSRARAAFEQADVPLEAFAGRQILVRGVVFEAGGPAIDVRWTEQVDAGSGTGVGN